MQRDERDTKELASVSDRLGACTIYTARRGAKTRSIVILPYQHILEPEGQARNWHGITKSRISIAGRPSSTNTTAGLVSGLTARLFGPIIRPTSYPLGNEA